MPPPLTTFQGLNSTWSHWIVTCKEENLRWGLVRERGQLLKHFEGCAKQSAVYLDSRGFTERIWVGRHDDEMWMLERSFQWHTWWEIGESGLASLLYSSRWKTGPECSSLFSGQCVSWSQAWPVQDSGGWGHRIPDSLELRSGWHGKTDSKQAKYRCMSIQLSPDSVSLSVSFTMAPQQFWFLEKWSDFIVGGTWQTRAKCQGAQSWLVSASPCCTQRCDVFLPSSVSFPFNVQLHAFR